MSYQHHSRAYSPGRPIWTCKLLRLQGLKYVRLVEAYFKGLTMAANPAMIGGKGEGRHND